MKQSKILIIEDDAYISEMYEFKLVSDGYLVEVVPDGYVGLDYMSKHLPKLVLLDIVMPKIDGFAVLQKIRENPQWNDVPVVMLTNLGQKDNVDRCLEMGANGYIIKAHFTPAEVLEEIKKYI